MGKKATLNAPLLVRVLRSSNAAVVVHLHDTMDTGWPVYPYAPPGTVRDNNRSFDTESFNIAHHGCVFVPG